MSNKITNIEIFKKDDTISFSETENWINYTFFIIKWEIYVSKLFNRYLYFLEYIGAPEYENDSQDYQVKYNLYMGTNERELDKYFIEPEKWEAINIKDLNKYTLPSKAVERLNQLFLNL